MAPIRGSTHRTDTMAFRKFVNHLNVDWIVRSMEERDYGIDLQLEIFDNSKPTGTMILGQLKGTEGAFEEEETFQFPVKTLLYAELFNAPFFLFRTSILDNETRFIWLQKFIETKASTSSPNWRNQQTIQIAMPEENNLVSNADRFLMLAREQERQRQALQFMRIECNLALHGDSVLLGEHGVAAFCSSEAYKLLELREFIIGGDMQGESDYNALSKLHDSFDRILFENKINQEDGVHINKCLGIMNTIKISYLSEPEIHNFVSTEAGVIYY